MVLAADAVALAAGLRVGMPMTKAQVLVRDLTVQDADPSADEEAMEQLAIWLLRIAPIVAPDPPNGIVIDSIGADHLHGGETAMLEGLIGRLALSGIAACAAIADTWGVAQALARYVARQTIIAQPAHGSSILEPLPASGDSRLLSSSGAQCATGNRPWRPLGAEPDLGSASTSLLARDFGGLRA